VVSTGGASAADLVLRRTAAARVSARSHPEYQLADSKHVKRSAA
jgi:hypothetical protein